MKTYNKKLYKSNDNKVITGVMGGLGEYLDIDPVIFRAVYTGLVVFTGILPGTLAYIIVSLVVPKKPDIIREKAF